MAHVAKIGESTYWKIGSLADCNHTAQLGYWGAVTAMSHAVGMPPRLGTKTSAGAFQGPFLLGADAGATKLALSAHLWICPAAILGFVHCAQVAHSTEPRLIRLQISQICEASTLLSHTLILALPLRMTIDQFDGCLKNVSEWIHQKLSDDAATLH